MTPLTRAEQQAQLLEMDGQQRLAMLEKYKLLPERAGGFTAELRDIERFRAEAELAGAAALRASAPPETTELLAALKAILTASRGDEKSECLTIRKYLDDRDVFNDDIQGADRLIALASQHALKTAKGTP